MNDIRKDIVRDKKKLGLHDQRRNKESDPVITTAGNATVLVWRRYSVVPTTPDC